MKELILQPDQSIKDIIESAKSEGLALICISNAGLQNGALRLTFLPQDMADAEINLNRNE